MSLRLFESSVGFYSTLYPACKVYKGANAVRQNTLWTSSSICSVSLSLLPAHLLIQYFKFYLLNIWRHQIHQQYLGSISLLVELLLELLKYVLIIITKLKITIIIISNWFLLVLVVHGHMMVAVELAPPCQKRHSVKRGL